MSVLASIEPLVFHRVDYTSNVPVAMICGNMMTTPTSQRQLSAFVSHNVLGIRYSMSILSLLLYTVRVSFCSLYIYLYIQGIYGSHKSQCFIILFRLGYRRMQPEENRPQQKFRNEYKITYLHGNEFKEREKTKNNRVEKAKHIDDSMKTIYTFKRIRRRSADLFFLVVSCPFFFLFLYFICL